MRGNTIYTSDEIIAKKFIKTQLLIMEEQNGMQEWANVC